MAPSRLSVSLAAVVTCCWPLASTKPLQVFEGTTGQLTDGFREARALQQFEESPPPLSLDVQWVRQLGSAGYDRAYAVIADAGDHHDWRGSGVFVVGYTDGRWGDADGELVNATSASVSANGLGGMDALLVKLDPTGKVIWSRRFGSATQDDWARAVAVDNSGDVFVTGGTLGSLEGNFNEGDRDIFLVKYNWRGERLWATQFGTHKAEEGMAVAVDGQGDVYVAGSTQSAFGTLERHSGAADAFLSKHKADGTRSWTRYFGTANDDEGLGVATSGNGHSYVVGRTQGSLLQDDDLFNIGGFDAFLVLYNSTGDMLWKKQFGTPDHDEAVAVAVDPGTGGAFVVSQTYWPGTDGFRGGRPGSEGLFPKNVTVSKWFPNGELAWIRVLYTAGVSYKAESLAVDARTNIVYVAGMSLDTGRAAQDTDFFLATYGPMGGERFLWTPGSKHWDQLFGVCVGPNNVAYTVGSTQGSFHGLEFTGNADMLVLQWSSQVPGAFEWQLDEGPSSTSTVLEVLGASTTAGLSQGKQAVTDGATNKEFAVAILAALGLHLSFSCL